MTHNKRIGKKIWWGLLILWVSCLIAGIFYLFGYYFDIGLGLIGTPSFFLSYCYFFFEKIFPGGDSFDIESWVLAVVYIGLFIFSQWLFLSSKKHWKIKTEQTGRPMRKAVIGVAFPAMLLSFGVILSFTDLISDDFFNEGPTSVKGVIILSLPLVFWVIWSIVFTIYFFQKDYLKWSGKIIKGLIGGSILELFITIPIIIAQEDDWMECYCAKGSYAGLVFGITALLWAFGPGVFLLYLREKRRLETSDPKAQLKDT